MGNGASQWEMVRSICSGSSFYINFSSSKDNETHCFHGSGGFIGFLSQRQFVPFASSAKPTWTGSVGDGSAGHQL